MTSQQEERLWVIIRRLEKELDEAKNSRELRSEIRILQDRMMKLRAEKLQLKMQLKELNNAIEAIK